VYSDKLMARFLAPSHTGDIADPDGVGVEGNVTCGDVVQLAVKVDGGLITEATFRAQACATAIAAADACCDLVLGATVTAAEVLELGDVSAVLDGFPEEREGCAAIGLGALRSALEQVRAQGSPRSRSREATSGAVAGAAQET